MIYRILKEKGSTANIIIENTKNSTIMIGTPTRAILEVLEKDGHKFYKKESDEDAIRIEDKWSFDISEDTYKILANMTLGIHKPKRSQSVNKKAKNSFNKNKAVDAMDVLLGLANYN